MDPVALICISLLALSVVSIASAWKMSNQMRDMKRDVEDLRIRTQECDARYELLCKDFMHVLVPIRQNAEYIDQLDDDLVRLQGLYEELKKRE